MAPVFDLRSSWYWEIRQSAPRPGRSQWDGFDQARQALVQNLPRSAPASRYGVIAALT
jgi:hypothetical protein